jgi:putative endonuclease
VKYDKYYIGQTSDIKKRLEEHNINSKESFTSKYRPWELKIAIEAGETRSEAMLLERFIKKKKSRKFIEYLISNKVSKSEVMNLLSIRKTNG